MVRDKLGFYSEYIDREAALGRSTAEIIDELGDPQLIARTIIDAAKSGPDGIPGTDDDVDFGENIASNRRAQRGFGFGSEDSGYGSSGAGNTGSTVSEDGSPAESADSSAEGRSPWNSGVHVYNMGCITFILIMFAVFAVLGVVLQILSPILAPICIVVLIIWLFNQLSGGRR